MQNLSPEKLIKFAHDAGRVARCQLSKARGVEAMGRVRAARHLRACAAQNLRAADKARHAAAEMLREQAAQAVLAATRETCRGCGGGEEAGR